MHRTVVVLADGVSLGGADRVTVDWATQCAKLGSNVQVVHHRARGLLAPVLEERGISATQQDNAAAIQTIIAARPDAVVFNIATAYLPILPTIRLFTKRMICIIHSMVPWSHQFLAPHLAPLWDTVVVIAPHLIAEVVAYGVPESKVVCIENLLDTEEFCPGEHQPPRREFRFGYAGRADGGKRTHLLPDVLAALRNQGVEARLVLLGMVDGNQAKSTDFWRQNLIALQERVEQYGLKEHVEYLPPTAHPADFYRGLDATLLLSVSEGSPLMLWEGLACGTPFVSTDVGDVRDLALEGMGCVVLPNVEECVHVAARALRVIATRPPEVRDMIRTRCSDIVKHLRGTETWTKTYGPVLRSIVLGR